VGLVGSIVKTGESQDIMEQMNPAMFNALYVI
jgi:hypothetical protein